jgi:hypothetical protein
MQGIYTSTGVSELIFCKFHVFLIHGQAILLLLAVLPARSFLQRIESKWRSLVVQSHLTEGACESARKEDDLSLRGSVSRKAKGGLCIQPTKLL